MITISGRGSAPRALTCGLLAALTCALAPSAAQAATTKSFTLDARLGTRPVATSTPLKRDKLYIATVQGTFSYYSAADWLKRKPCGPFLRPMMKSPGVRNTFAGTDPEFTFAVPGEERAACKVVPTPFTNFQISTGARFADMLPIGGQPVAPNAAHRYRYLLTGKGKRARFRLKDAYTQDNYGKVRITVRAAPKGFGVPAPPVAPAPPAPPAPPVAPAS